MIDVIGATLVERVSQLLPEPVTYVEEDDSVQIGSPDHVTGELVLHTFRESVRAGASVEEVARAMLRLYEEAQERAKHPQFNFEQVIPHLVATDLAKNQGFGGTEISGELSVVLAFNHPDSVVLARDTTLAEAGVDFLKAGKQAVVNMRRILAEHSGETLADKWPDLLVFEGDLAADRAYAYVQTLRSCVALFADQEFAIVSESVTDERIGFLAFTGVNFAGYSQKYTHLLSTVPHIFENGMATGFALGIMVKKDHEEET